MFTKSESTDDVDLFSDMCRSSFRLTGVSDCVTGWKKNTIGYVNTLKTMILWKSYYTSLSSHVVLHLGCTHNNLLLNRKEQGLMFCLSPGVPVKSVSLLTVHAFTVEFDI